MQTTINEETKLREGSRYNLQQIVRRDTDRYYSVLHEGRKLIRKTFEENELSLFLDATRGTLFHSLEIYFQLLHSDIEDAIFLDGIDKKWSVDGKAIVEKLKTADCITKLALIDFSEYFWANCEKFPGLEIYKALESMNLNRD